MDKVMKPYKQKIGNMFFNISSLNENSVELFVYSDIASEKSYDYWTGKEGDEVTPNDFIQQLKDATASSKEIIVRINSNGGAMFAAQAIATHIKECNASGVKTICKIDGVCASAAVLIALACSTIMIPSSAYMMVHNPLNVMYGLYNAEDLRRTADTLDSLKSGIVNAYVERTGLSEKEISKMMDDETWLNGKKAVEQGFADELMFSSEEEVVNKIKGVFINSATKVPEALKSVLENKLTIQEGERKVEFKNIAELKTACPDFINQIEAEAKAEGAKAERARLEAIDKMSGKVSDEVLNKAKYETFETPEKVAIDALTNGDFVNTAIINGMAADAATANSVPGFVNSGNASGSEMTDAQKQAKFAEESAKKYLNQIGKGGK
jgi:ATP-dependent protease ClpP protease subunit